MREESKIIYNPDQSLEKDFLEDEDEILERLGITSDEHYLYRE